MTSDSAEKASHKERSGPLKGVRVLDLTSVLMGPYCTKILADHGADVIKVESGSGDTTRFLPGGKEAGMGGTFLNLNRGKRGIVLDLKSPEGRDAVLRLAANSDVFVHSMRPGAIARLNLTYEDIRKVKPDIIYGNMYGFGRRGRYSKLTAYDDVIQAASGISMLQAKSTGTPGYVASAVADKVSGLTGLYALLMALFHHARTGEGQEVEVGMFETMVSFNYLEHISGALFDPPVTLPYYNRVVSRLRRPYQTSDGYVSALVYNDKQWRSFVSIAGAPPSAGDGRFDKLADRLNNLDEVFGHIEACMKLKTTAEWMSAFDVGGIPCMPLLSLEELPDDEHLKDVGFFQSMPTSKGDMRFPGIPTWFSKTPGKITDAGPALGEHTAEVLREAGFSAAEVGQLMQVRPASPAASSDQVADGIA